jgi:hypothetical protein
VRNADFMGACRGWRMKNVIGVVPFTVCLALSVTKADSISLTSAPIDARVTGGALTLQWMGSQHGSLFSTILSQSFLDKGAYPSMVTFDRSRYLFFSSQGAGANYFVGQRHAALHSEERHTAIENGAPNSRRGSKDWGQRIYHILFETRIRRWKWRPSD